MTQKLNKIILQLVLLYFSASVTSCNYSDTNTQKNKIFGDANQLFLIESADVFFSVEDGFVSA